MRILVLGAGAIGGYFGGRLAEAGADVTFLVRPQRAAWLKEHGLVLRSALGDIERPVKTLLAETLREPYDITVLSSKSYDLDSAMAAIAPALAGKDSAVLPLLNGINHIDRLSERFGAGHVLGGACYISVTLEPAGEIRHIGELQNITFGELTGEGSRRVAALAGAFAPSKVKPGVSDAIVQTMWEKLVMLAALAATTTITRTPIGEILAAPSGEAFILDALAECDAVAAAEGHATRPDAMQRWRGMLTQRGSLFAASMMRDLMAGHRTEGDHIIGELVRRGQRRGVAIPILRVALANLETHEARRVARA